MRILKKHDYGPVTGYEFGWSPVGRPLMTAYVYRIGPVLIDTAFAHVRKDIINILKADPPDSVFLTHHHEDHGGNASAIKKRFNVPVYGHRLTAQKLEKKYRILPYQRLIWGAGEPVEVTPFDDKWEGMGFTLVPVHAPGHSKDHTVYLETRNGWLFSGDIYLGDRIRYFRSDEKIADQITSIKKILSLDFEALFCGHNPRPEDGKKFLARKLAFLEDFYGNVAALAIKGMEEKEIMHTLNLTEDRFILWLCFGNVSMKHMVRSVIDSLMDQQHFPSMPP
ncbi:MAG: MBL fold metallo-hydrolase [Deltaproteobacteria bacterium]|nr:MBL fold metallo-hydrolase [Deltaproteobacteria bacterium]